MAKFKNQKFKVANDTLCRVLQEELIRQGYTWAGDEAVVKNEHARYVYTSAAGRITYGALEDYYNGCDKPEMVFVTESRLVVAEIKPKREKVIVFGKTYYKDDVDAALAGLDRATV